MVNPTGIGSTCGKSVSRRRVKAPQSGRNPRKFQIAVGDPVSTIETPIGQTNWSKALVRRGADARLARAEFLRVAAREI